MVFFLSYLIKKIIRLFLTSVKKNAFSPISTLLYSLSLRVSSGLIQPSLVCVAPTPPRLLKTSKDKKTKKLSSFIYRVLVCCCSFLNSC